jgi:general secretion pathway protein B
MSYILEALKKAQAERQLGSAPTIHAMPIQAAAPAHAAMGRMPWLIAGGCLALLLAGAAVWWWRGPVPMAPAVLAVQPVTAEPPVVVAAPVQPVVVAQAIPVAPPVTQSPPPPIPQPQPQPQTKMQSVSQAPVTRQPVVEPVRPAPTPVAPKPQLAAAPAEAPAPEENLPFMNQLPEQQRNEVPKVSFGGYMYSKNPSDRLLLIDKVLRREGEEVAPGLVLEQLQPKAAVMNYRGTRYRVAY